LPVSETTNTKRYKNIHREKERKKERIHLMKTEIRKSISGLILIPLVLACFALLPSVQATPDPANPGGANTADGANALQNRTTGEFNTAFGTNALFSLTTGDNNGAQGNSALFSCTTGNGNSAVGSIALRFLTIGNQNVAIGNTSLNNVTTGSRNTAVGYGTARSGNSSDNTAVGWSAMISNTTGPLNVAVGKEALASNTTGDRNVAIGAEALASNTTAGNSSNAVGYQALQDSNGLFNNAFGWRALANVTTGANNTAMGDGVGASVTTGSNNLLLGANVDGPVGISNNIAIGIDSDGVANNRAFIGRVRGTTVGQLNGINVIIDTDGQLGTNNSSRRFKEDIESMDHKTSEVILKLKPVTFHYKGGDSKKAHDTPQYGLIAEEVEQVNPDLVFYDDEGLPLTVRYDAVNVMLLNEFLKEHKKVEEQQASITELKSTVALQQKGMEVLTAQLKEQASQIQRVSAQVELNKPAPTTAANK
jgi:hypothetical protein